MRWLVEHKEALLVAAVALLSGLNALTPHWSKLAPGPRKAIALLVELLSVVVSRGVRPKSGLVGQLKFPLTSVSK